MSKDIIRLLPPLIHACALLKVPANDVNKPSPAGIVSPEIDIPRAPLAPVVTINPAAAALPPEPEPIGKSMPDTES